MRTAAKIGLLWWALWGGVVLVSSQGWAQSYNAATSFEAGYTAQLNPNGVWSYGYSAGFTSPISPYTTTVQNGVNGPNAQYWLTPSVDRGNSPAAEYNNGPAYNDGNVNFLANEFVLVAGIGGQYSNLVFTAPANGTYSVASTFRGAQYGIGTVVAVVVNGNVVFSSKVTSVGQLVPFNTALTLKAGDTIVFSVGPGGGLQNTGLAVTITSTCLLTDNATYNVGTGILTMKFTIGTPVVATWNVWLTSQNSIQLLRSQALQITEPPVTTTMTQALGASGNVGILSTLTTSTGGITCSSWRVVNAP